MTNAITEFYNALKMTEHYEKQKKEASKALKDWYEILVSVCPHSEALDYNHNIRGWGTNRRCKICGVWDHGGYGSTPGDEYNYGTSGRPHPEFWKNANVEITKDEKVWKKYGKSHTYHVKPDGTVGS